MLEQPAIEVHLLLKLGKSMIGQNKVTILTRPGIYPQTHIANKMIQPPVPILHHIHAVVKEHMLHTVKVIEDCGKHALTEFVHQIIQYLDASIKDGLAQFKKLVVRDTAVF